MTRLGYLLGHSHNQPRKKKHMTNWEEIDVPKGAYIGWGNAIGQHVTGKVLAYDDQGGTDFAGNPCPQLSVELTEAAASFNKDGARTDYPAGELVVLNCGQVSLKRAVRAAALNSGDLVKIMLANLVKTGNGTVKEMSIKVARGAGGAASAPQVQETSQQSFDAAPAAGPATAQAPF